MYKALLFISNKIYLELRLIKELFKKYFRLDVLCIPLKKKGRSLFSLSDCLRNEPELYVSTTGFKMTDLVVNVKEVNHITTEQRDDSPHINIYQEQLILDQNSNI
jgi:hypothetical protein